MRARMPGRTLLTAVAVIGMLLYANIFSTTTALADGTTYYINNGSGSACNDASAGTSPASPWCDFTPVNSTTFGPGDHILLARGDTWNQELILNGSGSASAPAVLDAYGAGSNPAIIRNGNASDRGIRMNNPSYWNVGDLEIGHAGTGILVYYTTTGHTGLNFGNLYLHHIYGIHEDSNNSNGDYIFDSAGLEFTGPVSVSPSDPTVIQNVTIGSVEGTHNQDSIAFDWENGSSVTAPTGYIPTGVAQNVTLAYLNLHDDDAAGDTSPVCPDSLRLTRMNNVTVFDSILNREAACSAPAGTAAVILGLISNVTFTNNMLTNTPEVGVSDETAVDHETTTDHVSYYDNYIAGNAGGGLSFLTIYPSPNYDTNNEVGSNTFANNGLTNTEGSAGGIRAAGDSELATGTVHDNLYYEPEGFTHTDHGGSFSSFTFNNNLGANSAANLYYAANGFSDTQGSNQWSYQYTTNSGASWNNLPNFDGNGWSPSAGAPYPRVQQFDIIPDACASCSTARAWTAPSNGIVSLRGRILKSDDTCGDGVVARITQNGNTIWGPQTISYNDRVGIDANLDNVLVSAGDTLRFEVNPGSNGQNACDWTSWVPSVGYAPVFNRYYNSSTGYHWVTTDFTAGSTPGYALEFTVGYLFTAAEPGTHQLYSCLAGQNDHFISVVSSCEGQTLVRTEGWIYNSPPSGLKTNPLYRCWTGHDHFVSTDPGCEHQTTDGLLGYAIVQP